MDRCDFLNLYAFSINFILCLMFIEYGCYITLGYMLSSFFFLLSFGVVCVCGVALISSFIVFLKIIENFLLIEK